MRRLNALLVGVALLASGLSVTHASEPLRLSTQQLDNISAGLLEISVDAAALAEGANPVTDTQTFTSVVVGEPEDDGYTYTTGDGYGLAYAKGESVYTATDAGFYTDEEIVSFEFGSSLETRVVAENKGKKHKKNKNKHKKNKNNKSSKKKHKNNKNNKKGKNKKSNKKKQSKKKNNKKGKKNKGKKKKHQKKGKHGKKQPVIEQTQTVRIRVVTRAPSQPVRAAVDTM